MEPSNVHCDRCNEPASRPHRVAEAHQRQRDARIGLLILIAAALLSLGCIAGAVLAGAEVFA